MERAIPSSGEQLPVIGIGTARRWESTATSAEVSPLRDVLRELAAPGGKVVDTAPERTMRPEKLDFIQVDYALDNRESAEALPESEMPGGTRAPVPPGLAPAAGIACARPG